MRLLRRIYPTETRLKILKVLPGRSWWSICGKATALGLKRPAKVPISMTLFKEGDVGYSAGMIIADGSIMETLVSSGKKRGKLDGEEKRPQRWYSMPEAQVSMEDKQSLIRLAKMWGAHVGFCQKSSVGNDVWRVNVQGKKAYDLMKIILPYLSGEKRRKALHLLKKCGKRTSLVVVNPKSFEAFGRFK